MYKPLICKYRIHAHSLKIETGRYLNIDRQERICDFCNDSCIEDEFHLILKWKIMMTCRKKYIKPYYWKIAYAFKLVQLLSVCNIKELNNLGKFLYSAEKVRNCLT
jgi:hypothetical protein